MSAAQQERERARSIRIIAVGQIRYSTHKLAYTLTRTLAHSLTRVHLELPSWNTPELIRELKRMAQSTWTFLMIIIWLCELDPPSPNINEYCITNGYRSYDYKR